MAVRGGRRGDVRVVAELDVSLTRARGGAIASRTRDLGAGGMCVATQRPLAIDEELRFELTAGPPTGPVRGQARVLREQLPNVYALRFEHLSAEASDALARLLR